MDTPEKLKQLVKGHVSVEVSFEPMQFNPSEHSRPLWRTFSWSLWVVKMIEQLKRSFAIAKKDMLIFYLKGPVVIMGLIFPFFLFPAFLIGRNLSGEQLFVGLTAMTAFFTSTAVGPTMGPSRR